MRQAAVPLLKRDGSPGLNASDVSRALNRPDQNRTFLKVESPHAKCSYWLPECPTNDHRHREGERDTHQKKAGDAKIRSGPVSRQHGIPLSMIGGASYQAALAAEKHLRQDKKMLIFPALL